MDVAKATITFIVLEFVTIFIWFAVVVNLKTVIQLMVTGVNNPHVTTVGQNVVNGFNILFIVLIAAWIIWYLYVLHALTQATMSAPLNTKEYKRW